MTDRRPRGTSRAIALAGCAALLLTGACFVERVDVTVVNDGGVVEIEDGEVGGQVGAAGNAGSVATRAIQGSETAQDFIRQQAGRRIEIMQQDDRLADCRTRALVMQLSVSASPIKGHVDKAAHDALA